jgi:hypothetical protein
LTQKSNRIAARNPPANVQAEILTAALYSTGASYHGNQNCPPKAISSIAPIARKKRQGSRSRGDRRKLGSPLAHE